MKATERIHFYAYELLLALVLSQKGIHETSLCSCRPWRLSTLVSSSCHLRVLSSVATNLNPVRLLGRYFLHLLFMAGCMHQQIKQLHGIAHLQAAF